MYDSVTPGAIPADAEVVAGYDDGALYTWPESAWARFPNAMQVHITATGQTLYATLADVEWGDLDEQGAHNWRSQQAAEGIPQGGVYASLSRLGAVVAACGPCPLVSAHYTGMEHLCSEACRPDAPNLPADFDWSLIVATQWTNHGPNGENVDISLCAAGWPA